MRFMVIQKRDVQLAKLKSLLGDFPPAPRLLGTLLPPKGFVGLRFRTKVYSIF